MGGLYLDASHGSQVTRQPPSRCHRRLLVDVASLLLDEMLILYLHSLDKSCCFRRCLHAFADANERWKTLRSSKFSFEKAAITLRLRHNRKYSKKVNHEKESQNSTKRERTNHAFQGPRRLSKGNSRVLARCRYG